ncbi:MAG: 23S rRNA methyltransferase [Betaproteobacteria bacterium RIFCSPLOWO2_12_FULL_64_23]|nr:MAG: 23S rRNA methyltransferase [Betaproteobacteria bacterium RIFCSPLOWO2_12_FULL_64_23]
MKQLILKPGREKSLLRRHPWVFSGAVARVQGDPEAGDSVALRAAGGEFLAWAAYSPASQIRARVWSWEEKERIDGDFLRARLRRALGARERLLSADDSDALRLAHGESDGLPGVIADRYGDVVVLQLLSAGAERWRSELADAVRELTGCACVFERSDADVRALEGLPAKSGVLHGALPAAGVQLREHGLAYGVDVAAGHKTGFYLDQRDNRKRIGALARGREVLNCFCYTGGFTLNALAGGAKSVLSVDSSADALAQAQENLCRNELDAARAEWQDADVFKYLRALRDQGRSFDLVVLDPPKFAPTAAFAEKAARGYKDINLLALKLLRPGGLLASFSCSGGVSAELFQKILAGAALDAGVDASIVGHFAAAADHPVLLSFPEGDYLKGLLLRRG